MDGGQATFGKEGERSDCHNNQGQRRMFLKDLLLHGVGFGAGVVEGSGKLMEGENSR